MIEQLKERSAKNTVDKINDALLNFAADGALIMYFVAPAGVSPYGGGMTCLGKLVCYVIETFAVVSAGIHIACEQVYRNICNDLACPVLSLDEAIESDEIVHKLGGGVEAVEGIGRMVGNNSGIKSDPVVGRDGIGITVSHACESLGHPHKSVFSATTFGDLSVKYRVTHKLIASGKLRNNTAEDKALQTLAVESGIAASKHGTPAVSEHKEGKLRVICGSNIVKRFLVLEISEITVESLRAGISKVTCVKSCLAVADVIIGIDYKAGLLKCVDHVQITSGMLAKSVNELNNSTGLLNGSVAPGLDGVSAVGRREADFSYGHTETSLLFEISGLIPFYKNRERLSTMKHGIQEVSGSILPMISVVCYNFKKEIGGAGMHCVTAKGILSAKNGINIYRGCQHGCIYCDSRSACYHMAHDFEDIEVKENAITLLDDALRRKRRPCMVGTGSMSDPYMPLEEKLCFTRRALEVILKHGCGATVITKSDLVLRDIELLSEINSKTKCVVQMTLTTFDDELCRKLEPNVCVTSKRFEALKTLRDAGIPTVVWLCPILPFINDTQENIAGILDYCVKAQVKGVICFGMGLTLREGNREYFYKKLDGLFPGMKEEYIRRWGNSYVVDSPKNHALMTFFHNRCEAYGIMHDNEEIFGYLSEFEEKDGQLSLF